MAKDKPTKIASKKHLARLERERRQTQLITSISIAIVVIIVALIGYGILNETVLKTRRAVITVNGDSVSMHEYQVRVRIARRQFVDQYMQYYQFAQMFGIDPATDSSLSQTLNQIQSLLDNPSQVGQQVLDEIANDLLIRQYAKANGIELTAAEVEKAIHDGFGYYPDGTPTPAPSSTPLSYPTWSATQYALMTPTIPPTSAPTQTFAPTQTLQYTATSTSIPSITPTSTPYTLSGFEKRYKDGLDSYAKLGMTESDFRKIYFESRLYRQRVSDIITVDVLQQQEQVWARHILVADEATALSIRDQLLGGADFAALASQSSLDTGSKDKGGDLGWFGKGKMVTEFETAAFSLQVGAISMPVKSTNGWHIIQVLGHEIRPLTDTEYKDAVNAVFNQWLLDQQSGADIVIDDSWITNTPDQPSLQSAFNDLYATATAYANQPQQATSTP
jgi:parvulin-like peptidyl-prolyl isomerase